MTLMEILGQGNIPYLLIMCGIFVLMVVLLASIGKGVDARTASAAGEKRTVTSPGAADSSAAVTAAISAAVNEYRKK